ncbi:putative nucleotidyltransferase substrate binding domain-containing protein [Polynucleobacter necessarius]|uniref:putative nucleotidyltransferase substrate binding domain-containing protein n=1 Tax=Polynucleobacter necessarius TaxID=576610 RepID=UPI001E365595|nr:putative nucleotidyltransferase substrate binding domain-containing protein [Polynucleobacter necessarius]
MPNAFNFSASPFDCLNAQEQKLVRDNIDIAYFKEGEVILVVGSAPTHLLTLIKGFVRQFEDTTKDWLLEPTPDSLMNLAIFLDAHSITGDASLLAQVKQSLFALVTDNQFLLARFASAIESFSSDIGWWNRLLTLGAEPSENRINLKKAGIFSIVHGVRALALENHIWANSTSDRITELVRLHKIPKDLANETLESLHLLMELRLKSGLIELETDKEVSGEIDLSRLSTLERDLLKDALNVVKRFKTFLRQHFHLEFA